MALPQPNINNITNSLFTLSQELALLPNLPPIPDALGLQNAIQQLQQQLAQHTAQQQQQLAQHTVQQQQWHQQITNQLQQQQQQMTDQLEQLEQQVTNQLQEVRDELRLQPMRIYNSSVLGPYKGPNGFIPEDLPHRRDMLASASVNQCNALAQHLGFHLAHGLTVSERRKQLSEFLAISPPIHS